MNKVLTDKEELMIIELKSRGLSSREISKALWGVESRKSTVNDFLARTNEILEMAKIFIWDVETAPNIGYFWSRWKQNIGESQVIQNSYMLTWSGKWLGDPTAIQRDLSDYGVDFTKPNDKELVEELTEYLSEADIIVAHNGDAFDRTTFNARAVYHGIPQPSPYKTVDTLKIAKKQFRFQSNSLDSISKYLELSEEKMKVDFSLWRRVMEGDENAIKEMAEYCTQDVYTLEQVYLKLRPYDTRHPNVALHTDINVPRCTKCGSVDVEETGGFVYTNVSKFEHYRCNSCGSNLRGRSNKIDKDVRGNILANVVV